VLMHGLEGSKANQHVLRTASVYSEAGYGVLMFDLRGHGESEGERTTLVYREVRDVRGALSWLEEERGFEPNEVVLHGWSMGRATVLRSTPGREWQRSWRSRATPTCRSSFETGSRRAVVCRPCSTPASSLWPNSS
jgi:alpha-beta hydrolase superfamily lysophospholipase